MSNLVRFALERATNVMTSAERAVLQAGGHAAEVLACLLIRRQDEGNAFLARREAGHP